MPTTPPDVPPRDFRGTGKIAPASLRARLTAAIELHGLPRVSKIVGVDSRTILRAVAGCGTRHASIVLIELRLAEIEAAQAPATAESRPPTPPPEAK